MYLVSNLLFYFVLINSIYLLIEFILFYFNPLSKSHPYLMKFAIFGSVDIRPLPGAWVAELLGVDLYHDKIQ